MTGSERPNRHRRSRYKPTASIVDPLTRQSSSAAVIKAFRPTGPGALT
jgi:hypothetical protein